MPMSRKKVLSLWQARHGILEEKTLRERFLSHRETIEIMSYPFEWVERTFEHERNLETALKILKWRAAMRFEYEPFMKESAENSGTQGSNDVWFRKTENLKIAPGAIADLQVVGESFYKPSFDELRTKFHTEGNTRHDVVAELALDPHNQFSGSGMAVKVLIYGRQVGHIPESLAPAVFSLIEPAGVRAYIPGSVWFDSASTDPQRNSVQISSRFAQTKKGGRVKSASTPARLLEGAQAQLDDENWRRLHTKSQAQLDDENWRRLHPSSGK